MRTVALVAFRPLGLIHSIARGWGRSGGWGIGSMGIGLGAKSLPDLVLPSRWSHASR